MGSGVMRMEWSKKILVFVFRAGGADLRFSGGVGQKLRCGGALRVDRGVRCCDRLYFWKAKNENRSKYALKFVEKLADRYGIESTSRILETVLKD